MTLRYLLDTDTFIRVRRRRDRELAARFETLEPGDAAISVISYGELIYGAEKSLDREQTLRTLLDLVTLIPVLPLPARAGELYGVARRILEQKGICLFHRSGRL